MDNLEYKGYTGTVEYNKEDNCLIGKVLGMNVDSITYEGETLSELQTDFSAGIDSYLEGCREMGKKPQKPYSGIFNVRISSDVHARIATLAQQEGISINAFVKEILTRAVM